MSGLTDEQIEDALQEAIRAPHAFLSKEDRKHLIYIYNQELRKRREMYYTEK